MSKMKPRRPKSRFKAGQVVMVRSEDASFGTYPVKLVRRTGIGRTGEGNAWMDTLDNVEYEKQMRPLTAREWKGR